MTGTSYASIWRGLSALGIPLPAALSPWERRDLIVAHFGELSMSAKNPIRILKTHSVNYTDAQGEAQTREFRTTGPNGAMKIHPGQSVFLGMVTLLIAIQTPLGEIIQVLQGLVARIRVDGEVVLEPSLRKEEWFDSDGNSRPGSLVFDLVGDESRIALAALACKSIPALAKRVKSARAALVKRAAA